MAAYRTASRLFPASHVPLLYMGMEYLRTNNLALAAHFLQVTGHAPRMPDLSINQADVQIKRIELAPP